MTTCRNCGNACCDCSCPGCNCRTMTGPNGVQCCTMCITGLQRTQSVQHQVVSHSGTPQSVYMDQIMKQRLEAEQHNRFK